MSSGSKSGLSLLELLIALVLLAAITTGMLAATQFGISVLERSEEISSENNELAMRIRLRGWLTRASAPNLVTNIPLKFEGSENGFEFTTFANPEFAADSAALRIKVEVRDAKLVCQITPLNDDGEVITEFDRLLTSSAQDVHFSYYDDGEEPGWRETWEHEARLPRLVRITVDEGSTPFWPEFTVELPASR